MRVFGIVICGLLFAPLIFPGVASAQSSANLRAAAQVQESKSASRPTVPVRLADRNLKGKLNTWTIGLAAGQLEGAPLRFAAELALVSPGDKVGQKQKSNRSRR